MSIIEDKHIKFIESIAIQSRLSKVDFLGGEKIICEFIQKLDENDISYKLVNIRSFTVGSTNNLITFSSRFKFKPNTFNKNFTINIKNKRFKMFSSCKFTLSSSFSSIENNKLINSKIINHLFELTDGMIRINGSKNEIIIVILLNSFSKKIFKTVEKIHMSLLKN